LGSGDIKNPDESELAARGRLGKARRYITHKGKRISKRSIEKITEQHAERIGLHNPGTGRLEDRFTPTVVATGL
jgi:hypothetical protein